MLGTFRYVLALMVALSHLWSELAWWQGAYAVFCFYLISGYLMSKILSEVYTGPSGKLRYAANRLLRIFPPYLLVLALSVVAISLFPGIRGIEVLPAFTMSEVMWLPDSTANWLGNVTLLLPFDARLTVTQGWSLRVELVYYAAMLVLARGPRVALVWLAASACYVLYQQLAGASFMARYTSVAGASIAFSLGACIYHFRSRLTLASWHVVPAAVLFASHVIFAPQIWSFPREIEGFGVFYGVSHYGLHANLIVCAYLLIALLGIRRGGRWEPADTQLGNIAYAIFLVHWCGAFIVTGLGVPFADRWIFIPVSMLVIHLMSLMIYWSVERPLNRSVRRRIRAR